MIDVMSYNNRQSIADTDTLSKLCLVLKLAYTYKLGVISTSELVQLVLERLEAGLVVRREAGALHARHVERVVERLAARLVARRLALVGLRDLRHGDLRPRRIAGCNTTPLH